MDSDFTLNIFLQRAPHPPLQLQPKIIPLSHSHCPVTISIVSARAQSNPTLCNSMDCSPPGSSVHGILQAGILEWAAISSRGRTWGFCAPCPGGWVLYYSTAWEASTSDLCPFIWFLPPTSKIQTIFPVHSLYQIIKPNQLSDECDVCYPRENDPCWGVQGPTNTEGELGVNETLQSLRDAIQKQGLAG